MNDNTLMGLGVAAAVAVVGGVYLLCNIETVQAGYVGVRVNLYAEKGVQNEVVGTGRYFIGINEKLYQFPTFNQLKNYEGFFTFQTSDAMDVRANVGVEYNIDPAKVATVFTTYRKGIEEITDVNLRQYISDALIKNAVSMDINQLTQGGKTKLLESVTSDIRKKLDPVGVRIVKLSWMTDLRYPEQVRQSINAKIEATQRALLRENEVAQSKAEAEKVRVVAQGEADARLTRARAEAEAIAIKAKALRDNPGILQLNAIDKWNGVLPVYMTDGAAVPFVPVK
jgi:regulator of protease activity HflC (stomatin/prohibitin superfamily)